jgi:hypothetical protein
MNLMALGILCMHLFGGRPAPKLDPNPANWARSAFIVGDKAVTVAVPKGHRFEVLDPRGRGPIDLAKRSYQLMDAQYDLGCGEDADLPQFTVVVTIVRYPTPLGRAEVDMSEFAGLYGEALRASLPLGAQPHPRPSSPVVLAGRPWLAFSGQSGGVTGYATPLSRTHALAIDGWFLHGSQGDAAWYAQRLDILKRVAENVVITDQSP